MGGFAKPLVLITLVIVSVFIINSCSAQAVHHRFADDLQAMVKSSRSLADNAEQQLKNEVRILAQKHEITLTDDAIKVYVSQMNYNPLPTIGGASTNMRFATVRVSVTYEQQILPFYKMRYAITKEGKASNVLG